MFYYEMLTNPNFKGNTNELEVKEIDKYYIKDNKLYCYGLEDKDIARDDKKVLKTYIFSIKAEKIKFCKNLKLNMLLLTSNAILFFVSLILILKFCNMELGLFFIALALFFDLGLHNISKDIYMKCFEYYTLHKNEIKNYDKVDDITEIDNVTKEESNFGTDSNTEKIDESNMDKESDKETKEESTLVTDSDKEKIEESTFGTDVVK